MGKYMDQLLEKTKEELVNGAFNSRVSDLADYEDKAVDKHGHGKRIPYIGWFWRYTDFVGKSISIGDAGGMIGVMGNNKWGYYERLMTEQEANTFIDYLERAFAERDKGGLVSETEADAEKVFDELWDWFQTLKV